MIRSIEEDFASVANVRACVEESLLLALVGIISFIVVIAFSIIVSVESVIVITALVVSV